MTTTISIFQFLGWKNDDIFEVLANLSSPAIKSSILGLSQTYYLATQNGMYYSYTTSKTGVKYITNNSTIKAEDLHNYYDKHIGNKTKRNLIKRIEDDSTLDHVLFSLWDFIKLINEEQNLDFRLLVKNGELCMYLGDINETDTTVYEEGLESKNLIVQVPILNTINKKPNVYTYITAANKPEHYYSSYEYPASCGPYGLHNSPCTCSCSCDHSY